MFRHEVAGRHFHEFRLVLFRIRIIDQFRLHEAQGRAAVEEPDGRG